jgi:hypothetical protein
MDPGNPGNYLTIMREPYDDEQYVMSAYERHLNRCTQCVSPLNRSGRGSALCGRGYKYARDVASYLFSRNGKHFSVVASESGRLIQVKTPQNPFAVRNLLAAIEAGLHLYPQEEITSDLCQPRQPVAKQIQPQYQSPKLKTYKIIERKPRAVQPTAPLHPALRRYSRPRSSYIFERRSCAEPGKPFAHPPTITYEPA